MPAVDIDPPFHGAASELIDPRRWGIVDTGATMADDVCAFAFLACEVRMEFAASLGQPLNETGSAVRFLLGDPSFPTRALSQEFTQH